MSIKPKLTQNFNKLTPIFGKEEFRQIYVDGKKCKYYVSNLGRIFNKKTGKYLTPHFDGKYYSIRLSLDGKVYSYKIHRIVAIAFIPTNDINLEVNHINGDKSDNTVGNLEWVTSSENCIKAILLGLKPKTVKLSLEEVRNICELISVGKYTSKEISTHIGCSKHAVKNIKQKLAWKYISDEYF